MPDLVSKIRFLSILIIFGLSAGIATGRENRPFVLRFIDSATQRPVPLVEVELFNALRMCSDNLGNIAILEPDLTDKKVRLLIRGHGYRYPRLDIFRERSLHIEIKPGEAAEIELERTTAAERLYRITGSGRLRDSLLAGLATATGELPGNIIGLDSAIPVFWKNRLYSFYGDTLAADRLNLSGSGGEITLNMQDVPESSLPVNFFCDSDGFASRMIELPEPGFVWIETVIPVVSGNREILVARYVRHKTLEEAVETGFALFNPVRRKFSLIKRFRSARQHKSAHAVMVNTDGNQAFCIQPWEKTGNNLKEFINPDTYKYYTCLQKIEPDSAAHAVEIAGHRVTVKRDADGRPEFSWVRGGVPFTPANQRLLQAAGLIKSDERWLELTEIGTGRKITDFSGSISWNHFRQRWIMIAQGLVGEIWYSEADTFTGPWVYGRRIVEHDGYNFYNPVQHSWFDAENGRTIYFEGTYTSFFTRDGYKTPRADYNQVMYRLDLQHPSLLLPAPVYRIKWRKGGWRLMTGRNVAEKNLWSEILKVEFLAFDENNRNHSDLQPVYDHADAADRQPELSLEPGKAPPVFYSLKDNPDVPANLDFAPEFLASGTGTVFINTSECLTLSPEIRPE